MRTLSGNILDGDRHLRIDSDQFIRLKSACVGIERVMSVAAEAKYLVHGSSADEFVLLVGTAFDRHDPLSARLRNGRQKMAATRTRPASTNMNGAV